MGLDIVSRLAEALWYYGARDILVRTYFDQGDLVVVWACPEDIAIGLDTGTIFISAFEVKSVWEEVSKVLDSIGILFVEGDLNETEETAD